MAGGRAVATRLSPLGLKQTKRRRFLMPPFRAVRTNRNQPGITRVTLDRGRGVVPGTKALHDHTRLACPCREVAPATDKSALRTAREPPWSGSLVLPVNPGNAWSERYCELCRASP